MSQITVRSSSGGGNSSAVITFGLSLTTQNPAPVLSNVIRFRSPYDFTPTEWKISAMNGTEIEFDIWKDSLNWPTFSSASICNSSYPALISGSDSASGSCSTWETIAKDDYLTIFIRSGTSLANEIVMQVKGDVA